MPKATNTKQLKNIKYFRTQDLTVLNSAEMQNIT